MVKTMRKKKEIAEYQMKKRDKLSFREEIKVLLRNTMNRPDNKTLQDVIDYAKKYYLMDVRLRGNTIYYALKYRTDKKGKSMAVRGSRLGASRKTSLERKSFWLQTSSRQNSAA